MATNAQWTVIFEDKKIIKNYDESLGHTISDSSFWEQSKFSNIWAIQYGTSVSSDEVEYRDTTPHSTYVDANLGEFSQFINKWDEAHLAYLQAEWDNNNLINEDGTPAETSEEKITRLGARPTSYSS